jgi:hypothetical protein
LYPTTSTFPSGINFASCLLFFFFFFFFSFSSFLSTCFFVSFGSENDQSFSETAALEGGEQTGSSLFYSRNGHGSLYEPNWILYGFFLNCCVFHFLIQDFFSDEVALRKEGERRAIRRLQEKYAKEIKEVLARDEQEEKLAYERFDFVFLLLLIASCLNL